MSDRRQFLKSAGVLGAASLWPKSAPQIQTEVQVPSTPNSSDASGSQANSDSDAVVLENREMRLVFNANGSARSLLHKASGQECLAQNTAESAFNLTQYRPYDNELQLTYPAKITQFNAKHIRRDGDRLIVRFDKVGYEAAIALKITEAYISFRLEKLTYTGYTDIRPKEETPIDESVFLQLPVRDRKNYGDWLNVIWDESVAVNLLATDVMTQIDGKVRDGYHLLQAGSVGEVQLEGVGAALIVTIPSQLLDRIAKVEEDFDLPRGVESRRCEESRFSYYQAMSLTPEDAERQIRFAKMGGFRLMNVYCFAFSKTAGHFPWRPEYPRGIEDLKDIISKVISAGIIAGFHILYTMANEYDAYVSPEPDPRLNLLRSFTLSEKVDASATSIPVEENPRLCAIADGTRVIRIQNELIYYKRYSIQPPYRFEGCERGALGTRSAAHEKSSRVGLLDMFGDSSPEWLFMRFSQNTSVQNEVAERIAEIYKQAQFKFMYFDGAEQVPAPYWHTIPRAKQLVYDKLIPKPLFAEGSCKSHFSWHILSRGNAFDTAVPEQIKAATRAYPAEEVQLAANDFTLINFGWIGYWAPSKETIGTQPDMVEYVTSRAAAWDCPVSLSRGEPELLEALEMHPRTPDNLEVFRRWEDVRARNWLTEKQKMDLRNLDQEHTLLMNEKGEFELLPWKQIAIAGTETALARGFIFEYEGSVWVSYWHTAGEGALELSLGTNQMTLMREPAKQLTIVGNNKQVRLPLGERRYVRFAEVPREQVIAAFRSARVLAV
jgi:hypothetical protein